MSKKALTSLKIRAKQLGLTTVEYAVAGGLIAAGVVGAFTLLGGNVNTIIRNIASAIMGG